MCYTVLEPVCRNRLGMSMSNEDQTTALVAGETLSYQRDGEDYQLPVGTSAWYGWLQTATLFRVRSPLGTFTMRREQAGHKHGAWYWRACHSPRSLGGSGRFRQPRPCSCVQRCVCSP
jgi:hypothetical protein